MSGAVFLTRIIKCDDVDKGWMTSYNGWPIKPYLHQGPLQDDLIMLPMRREQDLEHAQNLI